MIQWEVLGAGVHDSFATMALVNFGLERALLSANSDGEMGRKRETHHRLLLICKFCGQLASGLAANLERKGMAMGVLECGRFSGPRCQTGMNKELTHNGTIRHIQS